jgi:hypothetical protein
MSTDRQPSRSMDATMKSAILCVAGSAALMAVIALIAFGARSALGVGLGGVIATVNLYVFARIGEAFISRGGKTGPWAIIGMLKLGGLFCVVWLILRSEIVPTLALVMGYSSLIVGIAAGTAFGPKPPEEE